MSRILSTIQIPLKVRQQRSEVLLQTLRKTQQKFRDKYKIE